MKTTAKQEDPLKVQWDRFLDAYSTYLREPSLGHAAELHLAGRTLEDLSQRGGNRRFSWREFEARLGWNVEAA